MRVLWMFNLSGSVGRSGTRVHCFVQRRNRGREQFCLSPTANGPDDRPGSPVPATRDDASGSDRGWQDWPPREPRCRTTDQPSSSSIFRTSRTFTTRSIQRHAVSNDVSLRTPRHYLILPRGERSVTPVAACVGPIWTKPFSDAVNVWEHVSEAAPGSTAGPPCLPRLLHGGRPGRARRPSERP